MATRTKTTRKSRLRRKSSKINSKKNLKLCKLKLRKLLNKLNLSSLPWKRLRTTKPISRNNWTISSKTSRKRRLASQLKSMFQASKLISKKEGEKKSRKSTNCAKRSRMK